MIDLRGHPGLPGFASYDDFTTDLGGLTYSDNVNTDIPIDGKPDAITPINRTTPVPSDPPIWQLVKGPAGSLLTTRSFVTDIAGVRLSNYYQDQKGAFPCTGDTAAWGQSGFQALAPGSSFPNTDPTLGTDPPKVLSTRIRYPGGPGVSRADAARLAERAQRPIQTTVSN